MSVYAPRQGLWRAFQRHTQGIGRRARIVTMWRTRRAVATRSPPAILLRLRVLLWNMHAEEVAGIECN
jgi:hypothetical protein